MAELPEGDFVIRDYVFRSGEILPELKLHYGTLGTAQRNAFGKFEIHFPPAASRVRTLS
ncbi:MAG TPA: hypothetical protein VJ349_16600 [Stellaceae bacterium]|nr:hypothetical protein [Stellaceae bacterium]